MARTWVTTSDNPFDYFEDFDRWYNYDEEKGYHTCAYMDRLVKNSDVLSEETQDTAIETAVDEVVDMNLIGMSTNFKVTYKKVVEKS